MNTQTKKYIAVVVHFGPPDVTNHTINSLLSQSQAPDTILVVDNDPTPFSASPDPKIHTIRPNQNLGYAAGINFALGYLLSVGANRDDVIAVMNNDLSFPPDFFAKLRRGWSPSFDQALLGVRVAEGQHQVVKPGYVNLFTGRTNLYHRRSPRHFWQLPYLHGAFLAARYRTFLQVPGWPDHYFLYWEDVSLSHRARRRHLKLKLIPGLEVSHPKSTQPPTDQQVYYLVRNGALFLEQETSWPWRAYWLFANRLRWAYHTLNFKSDPLVKDALTDAILRKTGPRLL